MNFNNFLLGLLVCFLLSFLLGLERQIRRRFIGLRTMILVAIGSYLFVAFSFLVTGYQTDVTRIASQVVAGIGFLGAGVIIKDSEKNKIRGLTTAATLWCDASIGILCAGGFVREAIVASLLVLFSNSVLRYVNSFINNKVDAQKTSELFFVKFTSEKNESNKIMEFITNYINKADYIEINNYNVSDNDITLEITVKKTKEAIIDKFIAKTVADFSIKNYQYKKLSEIKLEEDNEEL